jgi:hypothetical protein
LSQMTQDPFVLASYAIPLLTLAPFTLLWGRMQADWSSKDWCYFDSCLLVRVLAMDPKHRSSSSFF